MRYIVRFKRFWGKRWFEIDSSEWEAIDAKKGNPTKTALESEQSCSHSIEIARERDAMENAFDFNAQKKYSIFVHCFHFIRPLKCSSDDEQSENHKPQMNTQITKWRKVYAVDVQQEKWQFSMLILASLACECVSIYNFVCVWMWVCSNSNYEVRDCLFATVNKTLDCWCVCFVVREKRAEKPNYYAYI